MTSAGYLSAHLHRAIASDNLLAARAAVAARFSRT
jgi:hypothetical protein